jgi:hypothetical protein
LRAKSLYINIYWDRIKWVRKQDLVLEAKPALRKIFAADDPIDCPFADSVKARTIVYPCHGSIELDLITAIINTALSLEDKGCYISLLSMSQHQQGPNHCYIPLSIFIEGYINTDEAKLIGPKQSSLKSLDLKPHGQLFLASFHTATKGDRFSPRMWVKYSFARLLSILHMYTLTETQYSLEAEPMLRKVFINDNPYNQPFSEKVTARIIIYPCKYSIEKALPIQALIDAAAMLGDTACYISVLMAAPDELRHCYIPLSELLEGYDGIPGSEKLIGARLGIDPYEMYTTIYSAQGKWGIMTTDESHGILGGSQEFINEIRKAVPNLDNQVYGFLKRLRWYLENVGMGSDISQNEWLLVLLAHIYGQDQAEKLIQDVNEMSAVEAPDC